MNDDQVVVTPISGCYLKKIEMLRKLGLLEEGELEITHTDRCSYTRGENFECDCDAQIKMNGKLLEVMRG
jgi:hypothetical protein